MYICIYTGEQPRFDSTVTNAVKFLTTVVKKQWNKELFNNMEALVTTCEKVVIPQIKLRESDVELFQMNGLEYVRRDMEGSDVDTRRRMCNSPNNPNNPNNPSSSSIHTSLSNLCSFKMIDIFVVYDV